MLSYHGIFGWDGEGVVEETYRAFLESLGESPISEIQPSRSLEYIFLC